MLSKEEFDAAITRMEVYPAGVSPSAWGTGLMSEPGELEDEELFFEPGHFTIAERKEHG